METHLVGVTACLRHTLSLCLSLLPRLAAPLTVVIGSRPWFLSLFFFSAAALARRMQMIYRSSQTWMHNFCSGTKKHRRRRRRRALRHANRMISNSLCFLPLFFEPLSLFPVIHTHTHTHTHINSPLGVCCFHYLQLGPETAFRVEYSRAELARIAVYIARRLVIASSLCSLSPVRQVESMNLGYLGTSPAALRRISPQLSVPPQGTSNRGKTECLKASESPTTATLTIHTAVGMTF